MSERPQLQLKKAPIIEAVLDIECDLPPKFRIKSVEDSASKELTKNYPKKRTLYVQDYQFAPKAGSPLPEFQVKNDVAGIQFLHNDERQVVQFRSQGFSFNRLSPYSSLDDYLPQIKKAWLIYLKLATPVQIRVIRLRYINRIPLPFLHPDGEKQVDVGHYFKNYPRIADPKRFITLGFLNQYSAIDKVSGNSINSVLTAQPPERDILPVIFDNGVENYTVKDPASWDQIRVKILELRELKNHIFQESLTEKCLNQFQ